MASRGGAGASTAQWTHVLQGISIKTDDDDDDDEGNEGGGGWDQGAAEVQVSFLVALSPPMCVSVYTKGVFIARPRRCLSVCVAPAIVAVC